MRITGLATGIDTDSYVKDMMKPYQAKVDKKIQEKEVVQWKQDMYRSVIKDMRDFYDKYFDPLSKDALILEKNLNTTLAKVEKESVSKITTSNGAKTGTYNLKVNKLAEPPKITSDTLSNGLGTDLGLSDETKLSFNVDGKSIDITLKAGATARDLMNEVNSNLKSYGIKAEYSEFTKKLSIESTKTGEGSKIEVNGLDSLSGIGISSSGNETTYKSNKLDLASITDLKLDTKLTDFKDQVIKIGDKEITISEDDTVADLMSKIKENGGDTVKFTGDGITFETKGTQDVTLNNKTLTTEVRTFNEITGSNAEYEIILPGSSEILTLTNESNNFSIDGINFSLNGVGETTFTISKDTEGSVDKIKGFVEDYNKLIDSIYSKVSEKKTYGYDPLTDEQKSEMTEKEIELWEAKAKQGLLKNDNELNSILSNLREAILQGVEGAGITLKEIGITFTSDTTKPGQLVLDETKLKDALETREEDVFQLFNGKSTSSDEKEKYNQSGIFTRMKDIFYNSSKTSSAPLIKKAGYEGTTAVKNNELTKKMEEQQKIIDKMQKDLATKENAFYQKFANLETVMNNLNSQQNYLLQQLGM